MKIGIDLGTTYSLAAHIERDGIPALIPDIHFRKNSTPSTVCLGNGSALVGWQAEGKFEQSPEQVRLLSFFKRQFGNPEPFAIDPAGNAWHPEALAALVLKKLRNDAEKQIGSKLQGAVLTVPAHFNDLQRRSTQVAAAMADIPLLGLLDEPVAAALHYGVANTSAGKEQIFFVYDLGGGTFDATVLSYHPQAGIDVLAQDGHTNLGGREFDEILQTYIAQQIGESFHWSAYALLQLRKAAEEVKIEFSDPAKFFIRKTILIGHWHKEITFSRREFEEQARTLLQQTVEISRRCLFEAKIPIERIDAFLLVGGSSMMPAVQQQLAEGLGIDPAKVKLHQPLHAVAFGAAIRAGQLSGHDQLSALPDGFRGVTGYHAGFRSINPTTGQLQVDVLIRKNASLNSKGMKTYYTRSAQQDHLLLDLVQYFDHPEDSVSVGQLVIGPLTNPRPNYAIEVCLEHTSDGRLQVRAIDQQTGREVRHTFANRDTETSFFLQQKALVSATMVNMVGESER
jgi:molecular chaperone DnaK